MSERYIVIHPDEDGNPVRFCNSKAEALQYVDPDYAGISTWGDWPNSMDPRDRDPNCWPETTALLLKVEVIKPREVKTVTEWDID